MIEKKEKKQILSKAVESFICNELYAMMKRFDRPFRLCIILSVISDLVVIWPIAKDQFNGREKQKISEFFEHLSVILTEQMSNIAMYAILIVNCLLFFYLSIAFVGYLIKRKQIFNEKIVNMFSIFFQLYPQVIGIISIQLSVATDSNAMSIVNFILSTIITMISELNNFDYRYTVKDFMAQTSDGWILTIQLAQYAAIYFSGRFDKDLLSMISLFILYSISFFYFLLKLPFMSQRMQRIQICRTCVNMTMFAMLLFDQLFVDPTSSEVSPLVYSDGEFDFLFSLIILVPVAYQVGSSSYYARMNRIIRKYFAIAQASNINQEAGSNAKNAATFASRARQNMMALRPDQGVDLQIHEVDVFLRYLQQRIVCDFDDYTNDKMSPLLEEIIQLHKSLCEVQQFCFCNKEFQFENSTREEFLGKTIRRQFLNDFIVREYKREIQKGVRSGSSGLHPLSYSFWCFLIDIMQNQTMSFVETIKAKNFRKKLSLSTMQSQKLQVVYAHALFSFGSFAKHITIPGKMHPVQLLETPEFDEQLEETHSLLEECLRQNINLLGFLQSDHLDLQELESLCSQVQEQKHQLHQSLDTLLLINPASPMLQNLLEDYQEQLSNNTQLSSRYRQVIQNQKTAQNCAKLYEYSKESCVIFISLLNVIGQVVKVSKNFDQVVPLLPNEEVIGKNVNFMMPSLIAVVHDQILLNFVSKEVLFSGLADYPLLIGVDKEGWSVPYAMKVQVSMIFDHQLGASTWVKQIKDANSYITINLNPPNNVFVISKQFYMILFKGVFAIQDISRITLQHIIPMINDIANKGNAGQSYETIMIKPSMKRDCNSSFIEGLKITKRAGMENPFIEISKYDIFFMRAAFFPVRTKFTSFIEIQVQEIVQVGSPAQLRDAMRLLNSQLIDLAGFDREVLAEYYEEFNTLIANQTSNVKRGNENFTNMNLLHQEHFSSLVDDPYMGTTTQAPTGTAAAGGGGGGGGTGNLTMTEETMQAISKHEITMALGAIHTDRNGDNNSLLIHEMISPLNTNHSRSGLNANHKFNFDISKGYDNQNQSIADSLLQQSALITNRGHLLPALSPLANNISISEALIRKEGEEKDIGQMIGMAAGTTNLGESSIVMSQFDKPVRSRKESTQSQFVLQQQNRFKQQVSIPIAQNVAKLNYGQKYMESDSMQGKIQSSFSAEEDHEDKMRMTKHHSKRSKNRSVNLEMGVRKQQINQAEQDQINVVENSIRSANTQRSSPRALLLRNIFLRKKITSLRAINALVVIFIFGLLLLDVINFISNQSFITDQRIEYLKSQSANQFIESMHNILTDYTMQKLMNNDYQPYKTDQSKEKLTLKIDQEISTSVQKFKDIYQKSVVGDFDRDVIVRLMQEDRFSFKQSDDYIMGNSQVPKYYTKETSLSYATGILLSQMILWETTPSDLEIREFILYYANLQSLDSDLSVVNSEKTNIFVEKYESKNTTQNNKMIETVVISIVFAFLVVFISVQIQMRRERILRLFSTISSQDIQGMIDSLQNTLDRITFKHQQQMYKSHQTISLSVKNKRSGSATNINSNNNNNNNISHNNFQNVNQTTKLQMKQKQQMISQQQQQRKFDNSHSIFNNTKRKKKRTISSTSTLPRFSAKLIIRLFVAICLLQSYSIATIITQSTFLDNVKNLRLIKGVYTNSNNYITEILQTTISSVFLRIYNSDFPSTYSTSVISQEQQLLKGSASMLQKFYDSQEKINGLKGIPGIVSTEYVRMIQEQDLCQGLADYPEYLASDFQGAFSKSYCDELLTGSLKQGLITSLKQVYSLLSEFEQIVEEESTTVEFLSDFSVFSEQYNFIDLYEYRNYCANSIHSILRYLDDMIEALFSKNVLVDSIFIGFQMSIILATTVLIWNHINFEIHERLHQTQILLDVIDISVFLSNSYVISYFKSNN